MQHPACRVGCLLPRLPSPLLHLKCICAPHGTRANGLRSGSVAARASLTSVRPAGRMMPACTPRRSTVRHPRGRERGTRVATTDAVPSEPDAGDHHAQLGTLTTPTDARRRRGNDNLASEGPSGAFVPRAPFLLAAAAQGRGRVACGTLPLASATSARRTEHRDRKAEHRMRIGSERCGLRREGPGAASPRPEDGAPAERARGRTEAAKASWAGRSACCLFGAGCASRVMHRRRCLACTLLCCLSHAATAVAKLQCRMHSGCGTAPAASTALAWEGRSSIGPAAAAGAAARPARRDHRRQLQRHELPGSMSAAPWRPTARSPRGGGAARRHACVPRE